MRRGAPLLVFLDDAIFSDGIPGVETDAINSDIPTFLESLEPGQYLLYLSRELAKQLSNHDLGFYFSNHLSISNSWPSIKLSRQSEVYETKKVCYGIQALFRENEHIMEPLLGF